MTDLKSPVHFERASSGSASGALGMKQKSFRCLAWKCCRTESDRKFVTRCLDSMRLMSESPEHRSIFLPKAL